MTKRYIRKCITNNQENANQNNNWDIHTKETGSSYIKKEQEQPMLVLQWGERNTHLLLVEMSAASGI